jgi:hypothetical protein
VRNTLQGLRGWSVGRERDTPPDEHSQPPESLSVPGGNPGSSPEAREGSGSAAEASREGEGGGGSECKGERLRIGGVSLAADDWWESSFFISGKYLIRVW